MEFLIKGKQIANNTITQANLSLTTPLDTALYSAATVEYVNTMGLISNYTNNRVLTSDGTKYGINAETNLLYNGATLTLNSASSTSNIFKIHGTISDIFNVDETLTGGGATVHGYFNIDNAYMVTKINSCSSGTTIISNILCTDYNAIFFDYIVMNQSNNLRAGTILAVFITSGTTVSYTEYSTTDIGDTSDVILSVIRTDNNIKLLANISSVLNWTIKTTIRMI